MSVLSFDEEIHLKVPPKRMFEVVKNAHTTAHIVAPSSMKSGALVKGDEVGVGCIKSFEMGEAYPADTLKVRLDHLDEKNYELNYTVTEGHNIGDKLKAVKYHYKFSPSAVEGEMILKFHLEHHLLPGVKFTEKDEEIEKEFIRKIFKDAEAYLLAHPEA